MELLIAVLSVCPSLFVVLYFFHPVYQLFLSFTLSIISVCIRLSVMVFPPMVISFSSSFPPVCYCLFVPVQFSDPSQFNFLHSLTSDWFPLSSSIDYVCQTFIFVYLVSCSYHLFHSHYSWHFPYLFFWWNIQSASNFVSLREKSRSSAYCFHLQEFLHP